MPPWLAKLFAKLHQRCCASCSRYQAAIDEQERAHAKLLADYEESRRLLHDARDHLQLMMRHEELAKFREKADAILALIAASKMEIP